MCKLVCLHLWMMIEHLGSACLPGWMIYSLRASSLFAGITHIHLRAFLSLMKIIIQCLGVIVIQIGFWEHHHVLNYKHFVLMQINLCMIIPASSFAPRCWECYNSWLEEQQKSQFLVDFKAPFSVNNNQVQLLWAKTLKTIKLYLWDLKINCNPEKI